MKTLTRLDLHGSGVPGSVVGELFTVDALRQLKDLPKLRTLNLINLRSATGFMPLKDLTQLREISMMMANLTPDELEALEEALPKTTIMNTTGGKSFSRALRRQLKRNSAPAPAQPSKNAGADDSLPGSKTVPERAAEPLEKPVAKGLEPFQGIWPMDICDSENRTLSATQVVVRNWRWAIKGNEVVWTRSGGEVWHMTYAVDPAKSPKEIDLTYLDGPFKGQTCQGIYEWGGVNKTMLQISVQDPGAKVPRPKSISMTSGGETSLIFLNPREANSREKELHSFQGTWKFEIIQTDGWPKPAGKGVDRFGRGDERQWVIRGNEIAWTSPEGDEVKAAFTIDPTKSPKHFDVTFLTGPDKGKTCPGIYEHGGAGGVVLWLCLVDPGAQAERPKDVSHETHSGRSMIGLIRVEPSNRQIPVDNSSQRNS